MRLDVKSMRYLAPEDWRVLTAVEMGSRNHEVVPTPLISQIAGLRGGTAAHKCVSNLAKLGLVAKVKNAKYDGYRLTYGGLDYLALHAHLKSSAAYSVGNQIGVGKESDIFVVAAASGTQLVLKIHRLGRVSFRTVKNNRDYLRNRATGSWMYLSRLSAAKEYSVLKALWDNGFPVPKPVAHNRHTVLMEFVDAFPLRQVASVPDPAWLYAELMAMIMKLAKHGLIHGDFNEFNILIKEEQEEGGGGGGGEGEGEGEKIRLTPILIDFPQAVSIDHAEAEMYFHRDVRCIRSFFERKYRFSSDDPGPFFQDAIRQAHGKGSARQGGDAGEPKRLDLETQASGFSKKMVRDWEVYMKETRAKGNEGNEDGNDEDEEDEDGQDQDEDDDDDEDEDEAQNGKSVIKPGEVPSGWV
ncbi:MAG: hypothetical protein M1815_004432 [Lichina confinis]|nr:MAG: hypothetical protein M1815_004432 [Lichina confinis]